MLRSVLSRLAHAVAARQPCCSPYSLAPSLIACGGQPLSSGQQQQSRTVISVKVYPGKLQAAQRALTRVIMGDKVCALRRRPRSSVCLLSTATLWTFIGPLSRREPLPLRAIVQLQPEMLFMLARVLERQSNPSIVWVTIPR